MVLGIFWHFFYWGTETPIYCRVLSSMNFKWCNIQVYHWNPNMDIDGSRCWGFLDGDFRTCVLPVSWWYLYIYIFITQLAQDWSWNRKWWDRWTSWGKGADLIVWKVSICVNPWPPIWGTWGFFGIWFHDVPCWLVSNSERSTICFFLLMTTQDRICRVKILWHWCGRPTISHVPYTMIVAGNGVYSQPGPQSFGGGLWYNRDVLRMVEKTRSKRIGDMARPFRNGFMGQVKGHTVWWPTGWWWLEHDFHFPIYWK